MPIADEGLGIEDEPPRLEDLTKPKSPIEKFLAISKLYLLIAIIWIGAAVSWIFDPWGIGDVLMMFFALGMMPMTAIAYITKYFLAFRSTKFRGGNHEFSTLHATWDSPGVVPAHYNGEGYMLHEELQIGRYGGYSDLPIRGKDFFICPKKLVINGGSMIDAKGDFDEYELHELPFWIQRRFISGGRVVMKYFKPGRSRIIVAYEAEKEDGLEHPRFDPHRMIQYLSSQLSQDELEFEGKVHRQAPGMPAPYYPYQPPPQPAPYDRREPSLVD